jgi:hypothetical protein
MFTVMFATGRTPGWIAHWCEMVSTKYKIGRPRQLYTDRSATSNPLVGVNGAGVQSGSTVHTTAAESLYVP